MKHEKKAQKEVLSQHQVNSKDQFKQEFIDKLDAMREKIQPLLYEAIFPDREEFIQRANFLYALIFKIRTDLDGLSTLMDCITSLELKYPLAKQTIKEVKNMPEVRTESL